MITVYKIVRLSGKDRRSFGTTKFSKWDTIYKTGKWTEPSVADTQLFAFSTYGYAEKFLGAYLQGAYEIWEAEAPDAKPLLGTFRHNFDEFWARRKEKQPIRGSMPVPSGTVLCSKIRLLKKVLSQKEGQASSAKPN